MPKQTRRITDVMMHRIDKFLYSHWFDRHAPKIGPAVILAPWVLVAVIIFVVIAAWGG